MTPRVQVDAYAGRLRCPRCGRGHCRVLGRRCKRLVRGVRP